MISNQFSDTNESNCHSRLVTIIIPAYNEEDVLSDCIYSILKNDYPKSCFEILIVDDGSTDKTSDIAHFFAEENQNVRLLSKENGGKASAQNFGLKYAQGKYILITDADAEVEKNWILKMIKGLENYDMVIGSYYAKNPKTWLEKIQNAHYLIRFKYGGTRGIPSVGVNNSFRKEVVGILGFFDETKTSITKDFIRRGKEKNLKILYDPSINVFTKCTTNFGMFIKQKLRWRESGAFDILSLGFLYTYGLSFLLISSLLFSLYQLKIMLFVFTFFIVYTLSFGIYIKPFLKMVANQENKNYALYFLIYEFVEMGVRIFLIPYIVFRLFRPRKKPTFNTQRD